MSDQTGYDPYNSLQRLNKSIELCNTLPRLKSECLPVIDQLLYVISFWGRHGATDDELEEWLDVPHQTLSARRRDAVLAGLIKDSGEKRKTRTGTPARVWVVDLGRVTA